MKHRINVLLLAVAMAGCETERPSGPPVATPAKTVVYIRVDGGMMADGWTVSAEDVGTFVHLHNLRSVEIRGQPGQSFAEALRLRDALSAAGVPDVTISGATAH